MLTVEIWTVTLVLEGLLKFLDPPENDAKASIAQLQALGVDVRILTSDNLGVAMKICRSLEVTKEINEENVPAITGQVLAQQEDEEFHVWSIIARCSRSLGLVRRDRSY